MAKKKLQHFAETFVFKNFFQPSYNELLSGFFLKGKWNKEYFKNDNPIILELGCGKGEYTVGLAKRNPDCNYIGIDIKGARMWRGAKTAIEEEIENVAFLRTHIYLLNYFFTENEISGIWITFPDPQPQKPRERKRLTSIRFLELYKKILKKGSIVHLKTDNIGFFDYTLEMINKNTLNLIFSSYDVYNSGIKEEVIEIQTHYEKMFRDKGMDICYLKFSFDGKKD